MSSPHQRCIVSYKWSEEVNIIYVEWVKYCLLTVQRRSWLFQMHKHNQANIQVGYPQNPRRKYLQNPQQDCSARSDRIRAKSTIVTTENPSIYCTSADKTKQKSCTLIFHWSSSQMLGLIWQLISIRDFGRMKNPWIRSYEKCVIRTSIQLTDYLKRYQNIL